MTSTDSLLRRLALGLVRLAVWLLPQRRGDWASAMLAELQHIDDGETALTWAVGCVIAVIRQRMSTMTTGDWKISRWIVAPEMLLCFLPLTIGWLNCIDILGRAILLPAPPVTASWRAVCFVIAALITATLGPVGLISGFRLVALNRPISGQGLRAALIAGPIFAGALLITQRLTTATTVGLEFWGALLLLSGLPLLAAMHLLHLSSGNSNSGMPAKLASSSPLA